MVPSKLPRPLPFQQYEFTNAASTYKDQGYLRPNFNFETLLAEPPARTLPADRGPNLSLFVHITAKGQHLRSTCETLSTLVFALFSSYDRRLC